MMPIFFCLAQAIFFILQIQFKLAELGRNLQLVLNSRKSGHLIAKLFKKKMEFFHSKFSATVKMKIGAEKKTSCTIRQTCPWLTMIFTI